MSKRPEITGDPHKAGGKNTREPETRKIAPHEIYGAHFSTAPSRLIVKNEPKYVTPQLRNKRVREELEKQLEDDARRWHDRASGISDVKNDTNVGTPDAKEEGLMHEPRKRKIDQRLDSYLADKGVPESARAELVAKFNIEIALSIRPKWEERGKYEDLKDLSSPSFLKRVYAGEIAPDGSIHKDLVRRADPKLMAAVDTYVSAREGRQQDMGDAMGLRLIASQAGRPKRADLG